MNFIYLSPSSVVEVIQSFLHALLYDALWTWNVTCNTVHLDLDHPKLKNKGINPVCGEAQETSAVKLITSSLITSRVVPDSAAQLQKWRMWN